MLKSSRSLFFYKCIVVYVMCKKSVIKKLFVKTPTAQKIQDLQRSLSDERLDPQEIAVFFEPSLVLFMQGIIFG